MSGVEHTSKFMYALSHMVVEAIGIAKHGVGFGAYRQVMGMMGEMRVMVAEAKEALPELEDLDSDDALELGKVAYACISSIVAAA